MRACLRECAETSSSLFDFYYIFNIIFFRFAKITSTSSRNCFSRATVGYSTEQAVTMVTDGQSPNVLAVGSAGVKV